jgi:hypothetical protein
VEIGKNYYTLLGIEYAVFAWRTERDFRHSVPNIKQKLAVVYN